MTVGILTAAGAALMWLMIWLLGLIGAPALVVWAPWYLPIIGVIVWTLRRRTPATVDEDGDESWVIHSLRTALVGVDAPRPATVRITTAVVLGGPIVWSLVIIGVLALVGGV